MKRGKPLTPIETDFIEIFMAMAEVVGVPRSVGEIYGLVYASAKPVSFQEIVDRLDLSKGSVSQGIRMLRTLGAVRVAYVRNDRRNHFMPETELRNLIGGLLKDRVHPQLEQGRQRLEKLRQKLKGAEGHSAEDLEMLQARVQKLEAWQNKSAVLLRLLDGVLA